MDIHIRGPIEFEKILDYTFQETIGLTRQRITIQQLIDQQDELSSTEDQKQLIRHLNNYSSSYKNMYKKLYNATLQKQPCFSWSVNGELIQTPCWLFEAIMPNIVNYELNNRIAFKHLEEQEYKEANKYMKQSEQICDELVKLTTQWKWKLPHMNHRIITNKFWSAQKHKSNAYQQLCTISVGIQQGSSDNILYHLSQRALRASAMSLVHWIQPETDDLLKISDALRYTYSSNILWKKEKYGQSIFRLEKWINNQKLPKTSFEIIKEEFDKIPFLLQERKHINDGAYFDTLEAATPLPGIKEIIHNLNIKHPEVIQQTLDQHQLDDDLSQVTSLEDNP